VRMAGKRKREEYNINTTRTRRIIRPPLVLEQDYGSRHCQPADDGISNAITYISLLYIYYIGTYNIIIYNNICCYNNNIIVMAFYNIYIYIYM